MDKLNPKNYRQPIQDRANIAYEAILESAKELIALDKEELLRARNLTQRAGYSTGTIYRYFKKLEDIFVLLFVQKRKQTIQELVQKIDQHSPHDNLSILINNVLEAGIRAQRNGVSKKLFSIFVKHYFRRVPEPEMFMAVGDLLIEPLYQAQRRDQTNTMKVMEINELKLKIRCIQTAMLIPMLEGSELVGTDEHMKLAHEIAISLLGKKLTTQ